MTETLGIRTWYYFKKRKRGKKKRAPHAFLLHRQPSFSFLYPSYVYVSRWLDFVWRPFTKPQWCPLTCQTIGTGNWRIWNSEPIPLSARCSTSTSSEAPELTGIDSFRISLPFWARNYISGSSRLTSFLSRRLQSPLLRKFHGVFGNKRNGEKKKKVQ